MAAILQHDSRLNQADMRRLNMETAKMTIEVQSENNMQKMREALETLLNLAYEVQDANSEYGPKTSVPARFIIDLAKSALAEPPRNYEVGTAEEQLARFIAFCKGQRLHSSGHADTCNPQCPCRDGSDLNLCALAWAQLPYDADAEKKGESDGSR